MVQPNVGSSHMLAQIIHERGESTAGQDDDDADADKDVDFPGAGAGSMGLAFGLGDIVNLAREPLHDDNVPKDKQLRAAVLEGRADLARSLIEQGASVEVTDDDGFAPLHLAAEAGNRHLVELLLHKHANPNIMTTDGTERVPLHFAATALGGDRVVKALIAARAEIDKTTIHGESALHKAGKLGFIDTVNVLLEANASVDAKDNYGMTPADSTAAELAKVPHAYFVKKAAANVLRGYMDLDNDETIANASIAGDTDSDDDEKELSLHQLAVGRARQAKEQAGAAVVEAQARATEAAAEPEAAGE